MASELPPPSEPLPQPPRPTASAPADLAQWQLALRVFAGPADTNLYGDIFGGWLLAQADIAAATVAVARAKGRVATVAIQSFQFRAPVRVGDLVDLHARLQGEGNSSMTVDISAWARRSSEPDEVTEVAQGRFIFVAVDQDGRSRRLPEIGP
jgi:acyl-CoA thioesterase YciA